MISRFDLRTGNYAKVVDNNTRLPRPELYRILSLPEDVAVVEATPFPPNSSKGIILVDYKNIEPAPTTRDWLRKWGFELEILNEGGLVRYSLYDNKNHLIYANETPVGYYEDPAPGVYLHEIQNVYFLLSEDEIDE